MDMRRIVLSLIWLLLGALLALAVLEVTLRQLPVNMGLYRTQQADRWPLQSSEAGLKYAYSNGWSMANARRGTSNNYGHIAPFDYKPDSHPVIVVGDSYVESLMNPYAETLQGQLSELVGSAVPVYGLGVSGLSASDYVALSRMALDEFEPKAAIFVVTDGDLSESLGRRIGNHFLVPEGDTFKLDYLPNPSNTLPQKIRHAVGDIALYRYFQVNLNFAFDNIFKGFDKPEAKPSPPTAVKDAHKVTNQKKIADWFLTALPEALSLPPRCIVLLMDSDRYAIYQPQNASTPKDTPEARQYLIEQARQRGFRVTDLEPIFREHYTKNHSKFDHWPNDRHWNRLGHGVAASEAYRALFNKQSTTGQACAAASQLAQ